MCDEATNIKELRVFSQSLPFLREIDVSHLGTRGQLLPKTQAPHIGLELFSVEKAFSMTP